MPVEIRVASASKAVAAPAHFSAVGESNPIQPDAIASAAG
jgi:hypothetical protein